MKQKNKELHLAPNFLLSMVTSFTPEKVNRRVCVVVVVFLVNEYTRVKPLGLSTQIPSRSKEIAIWRRDVKTELKLTWEVFEKKAYI